MENSEVWNSSTVNFVNEQLQMTSALFLFFKYAETVRRQRRHWVDKIERSDCQKDRFFFEFMNFIGNIPCFLQLHRDWGKFCSEMFCQVTICNYNFMGI